MALAKQHRERQKRTCFDAICRSVDGVRFWALHDRNLYFFMLISRWFVMHFGVILHDFGLPSGILISVYEWSSEHVKTRNFHHFLKRFVCWKNRVTGDVWRIFWKMNTKFGRKKVIHFMVICRPVSSFYSFLRDIEKKKRDTRDDLGVAFI